MLAFEMLEMLDLGLDRLRMLRHMAALRTPDPGPAHGGVTSSSPGGNWTLFWSVLFE